MQIDRKNSSARWRTLQAELAKTRADLAAAIDLLDECDPPPPDPETIASVSTLKSQNAALAATNRRLRSAIKAEHIASANLRSVIESTNTATIVLDSNLNIRLFTPATEEFFNIITADIGRPLSDLAPLLPDKMLIRDAQKVMFTGVSIDHEITTPDDRTLLRNIQPSQAEGGKIDGVIITYHDVTAGKQITAALIEERDEADSASHAKSAFLAAANHDLRQPLQAMAALHALLAQSAKDSGSKALVDRLDTSLQAIAAMLDTLLDDERVQDGTASIDLQPVPLETLFAALDHSHGLTAEAEGTSLTFVPTQAVVLSDPMLLQQMLSNLIGNALRFAPEGKVLVGARPRNDRIVIEIWDNGIGIDPHKAEEIFEAYKQISPTKPTFGAGGGQGLGLSIVKSLGELLGHPVAVRSIPGSGSVFSVETPIATQDETAPSPPMPHETPDDGSLIVHVIDDDPEVLQGLVELIRSAGHNVQCHPSAEDFLHHWKPENAGCLLVDAKLPGRDGLSLLQHLKQQGTMPPSIIITGKGDVATAAAAMRLGTIDFLEKPLPGDQLLASITKALAIDLSKRAADEARNAARNKLESLTKREREVLAMVLDGNPSKNISADLGVSQRTVENHRASMMRKTGSRSLAALVRLAIAAEAEPEA